MDADAVERKKGATAAHVLPFAAWLACMAIPGSRTGAHYALRSAISLALLLAFRPWRWYAPLRVACLPAAAATGAVVAVLWFGPETAWMGRHCPEFQRFYLRYAAGLLPRTSPAEAPPALSPYTPQACGWALSLARLAGSAFVIAVVEEFFWRGFLYRRLQAGRFVEADLGRMHITAFVVVAVLFAIEHERWLAGLLAGLAYGWLAVRTRDIWAAVAAHVTTNLLLGFYVLAAGAFQFW